MMPWLGNPGGPLLFSRHGSRASLSTEDLLGCGEGMEWKGELGQIEFRIYLWASRNLFQSQDLVSRW